jgi:hypothetical protein
MEQVHEAKEAALAEAEECATSSVRNAEKRGLVKKRARVQVQEGLDGKSEPARREFVYA